MDKLPPKKYLLEEILGEGSLFICFSFLQRSYGWKPAEFRSELIGLKNKNVFDINDERSDGGDLVSLDDINFEDTESLKSFSFLPKDEIWEEMKSV